MRSVTGRAGATDDWFFDGFGIKARTVPLVASSDLRVSAAAAFSLVLGVLALAATMTGLLAVAGVAVGMAAVAVAVLGWVGIRRRGLAGHDLAVLGIVCGAGAAVLGVLAIGGHLSWLSSRSDEVSRLQDWLTVKLPWLSRWQR
jgi:hypothetical protein